MLLPSIIPLNLTNIYMSKGKLMDRTGLLCYSLFYHTVSSWVSVLCYLLNDFLEPLKMISQVFIDEMYTRKWSVFLLIYFWELSKLIYLISQSRSKWHKGVFVSIGNCNNSFFRSLLHFQQRNTSLKSEVGRKSEEG